MRIGWAELVGLSASAILFISLYLPWFQTDTSNRNSRIGGVTSKKEAITAFVAYDYLQYALIAACLAPIILALLVLFNRETSWDRGEVTAIVGLTALVLILFNGVIGGRPDDAVSITLSFGYYLALLASLGIFAGGALRMMEKGPTNKPPGV
jgi:predicted lysophospholipase L1 biosynthesis ABC-type transport system permease subunit